MTDNPESIINEYLALVREKLPESIADDVITELEMYMLETAIDQGKDGQMTIESAKKVVAQFGAPGEVADEYRYSMLPETIPAEDIPPEIVHDTSQLEPILKISEPEKKPSRSMGIDPTTSYPVFFFKSFALIIMWASIISFITYFVSPFSYPYWFPNWQVIMILIQVFTGVLVLFFHTLNLKRKKIILWKRTYPDWSIFQNLVTLPENAVSDASNKIRQIDIAVSFVGAFLYSPIIFQWNHPWYILLGIPALLLLSSRLLIISRKLDEERDPYEKSRLEFVINFSLLIILNATVYWLFATVFEPGNMFVYWITPPFIIFVPLFGTVLLLQVMTGTQNLWWEKDDLKTKPKHPSIVTITERKRSAQKSVSRNGLKMFYKVSGWMVLFNSVMLFTSFLLQMKSNIGYPFIEKILWLIGNVCLVGLIVTLYSLFRNFLIKHWKSTTFVGKRSRLESIVDLGVSSFITGGLILVLQNRLAVNYANILRPIYAEIFDFNNLFGIIFASSEMIAIFIVIIAFVVRTLGNVLEFVSKYKISAAKRIEESGVMALVALALIIGEEFIKYSYYYNYPMAFISQYYFYLAIAIFLAFQVVSSGMKINERKNIEGTIELVGSQKPDKNNEYANIAN